MDATLKGFISLHTENALKVMEKTLMWCIKDEGFEQQVTANVRPGFVLRPGRRVWQLAVRAAGGKSSRNSFLALALPVPDSIHFTERNFHI